MIAESSSSRPKIEAADVLHKIQERRAVYLLLLIVVNLALFLPSMKGDFLWDDRYFICENPSLQGSGFFRSFLFSPFGGFSGTDENSIQQDRLAQFYRPLISLSYWLDYRIWGLNPAAFHLTNIVMQTANALILFFILTSLSLGSLAAFLGAVLFAAYPLHFENVSWISGRTDLLAFMFAGFAVLFFIRFSRKERVPDLLISAAACFLALLCKENVILLPAIFILFLLKKRVRDADLPLFLGPYLGALFAWFLLRWNALGSFPSAASGRTVMDFLAGVGFYSWKLVFPFNLSITVDSFLVMGSTVYRLLGAVIMVGFILSGWELLRKAPEDVWPYWVYATYVLLLLPSALVVLSGTAISLMAWRFLYLPSAVLAAMVAWLLDRRVRPRALAIGAAVLLSAFCVAELYPKNVLFGREESSFWLGIKNPDREDVIGRYNIGAKTLPKDEKKAISMFDKILALSGHPLHDMLKTWIDGELAMHYALKRDFSKADFYFQELFRSGDRQSLHQYFNYSYYLGLSGDNKRGQELVLKLIREFPRNHNVLTRAAKFYLIVHDYGKAAELYAEDYRLFRNPESRVLAQQAAELDQKVR